MPKDITDTTKLSSTAKMTIAATPRGIIAQESQGQAELVVSTQLPIQGLLGSDRGRWEALGVKILSDRPSNDSLFCHVELPAGWKKVPTDHSLWTDLVDETGKLVAKKICYKAAFYDRYAHVYLEHP